MDRRKRIGASLAVSAVIGAGALIIPAATASADTVAQWEAVAQCESNGVWNLPFGDGTSTGGLQIQDGTWADFGGLAYGQHAYQATESQQIAVAEAILAGQGPSAWTTITDGCAAAPSSGTEASSGASSAPAQQAAPTTPDPAQQAAPAAPSDPAQQQAAPAAPSDPAQQQSAPAPAQQTGDGDQDADDGVAATAVAPSHQYTVRSGDNLWNIAHAHGFGADWHSLYAQNRGTVGGNPNLIFPGQVLTV